MRQTSLLCRNRSLVPIKRCIKSTPDQLHTVEDVLLAKELDLRDSHVELRDSQMLCFVILCNHELIYFSPKLFSTGT